MTRKEKHRGYLVLFISAFITTVISLWRTDTVAENITTMLISLLIMLSAIKIHYVPVSKNKK